MTPAERWAADRYRPHRNYSAAEVRRILIEDGIERRATPLTWMVNGITYIAAKEKLPRDAVFVGIQNEVQAAVGLPLPTTGLVL